MPNPPFNLSGVPIIGQNKPLPFPIGGVAMTFPMAPAQIAATFSAAVNAGQVQPDITFAMLWTHTSVEVQQLRTIVMALANELAELRGEPLPFQLEPPLPRAAALLAMGTPEDTDNEQQSENEDD